MFEVAISLLSAFLTRFKSRARLEAEVLALRHQVDILNRTAPKRVRFTGFDLGLCHKLDCDTDYSQQSIPSGSGADSDAPRHKSLITMVPMFGS